MGINKSLRDNGTMYAKQKIFRVRRSYNQWVNNQTLEDYALRFTAKNSRKWSLFQVANTALGGISFLALEAIGAAITIGFGFENAMWAIAVVCAIIFFAGLPICYYATRYGVDIDLLTRGAGFGYLGSTATSLIYAGFTFIFFAIEAAIMAMALKMMFGLSLVYGYIICSLVIIPIVAHGITLISKFQSWTQPYWLLLQVIPFIWIVSTEWDTVVAWSGFTGVDRSVNAFDWVSFGAASAVLFALIAQVGEQVDYLRFLPPKTKANGMAWWITLVSAGPGWVVIGALKLIGGSLLVYVAMTHGILPSDAADPAVMYVNVFNSMLGNEQVAVLLAGSFIVVAQLKINVTNAYAGSIAWSNFFSRLTHSHPGRVVWLIFNVVIALMLMELGVYHAIEDTLGVYALVAVAWMGSLVSDLTVNKPLGLSPKSIEFRRAYLHDVNPVGTLSTILSCLLGVICYLGILGEIAQALSHYITLITAFLLVPIIAIVTKSRFYIAREQIQSTTGDGGERIAIKDCCICQNAYEREDMAWCPAYSGNICSLCCSLDSRCRDSCKSVEGIYDLVLAQLQKYLPVSFDPHIFTKLIQFVFMIGVVALIVGILLALIYAGGASGDLAVDQLLSVTLWRVFFILLLVAGVIVWLFILAHESKLVAQEESQRQTELLLNEITAHEKTDLKLQHAKETAESANKAKSRYLRGLSHELRTPLNSMLGYAQILEDDEALSEETLDKINIMRRNGEHLADLIEGLLDISKIEAGKLDVHRNVIKTQVFLHQIVEMFRVQAEAKNLKFHFHRFSNLPETITSDEKHLRQILINLLNNAIKFTDEGTIEFSIKYKNHVAVFQIIDSGVGIPEHQLENIFKPFERIQTPNRKAVPGTGLGLTITRLLIDVLGGDIVIANNSNGGICVTLSLMLPPYHGAGAEPAGPTQKVYGFKGSKKVIMVVDDDDDHRRLISDFLTPLGFVVQGVESAEQCLEHCKHDYPDLFMLDISMPGMDGNELSEKLGKSGANAPIIMVSALASSDQDKKHDSKAVVYNNSDDYIIKPVKFSMLLQVLEKYLALDWIYKEDEKVLQEDYKKILSEKTSLPDKEDLLELLGMLEVGFLSGFKKKLNAMKEMTIENREFISQMQFLSREVDFERMVEYLTMYISRSN